MKKNYQHAKKIQGSMAKSLLDLQNAAKKTRKLGKTVHVHHTNKNCAPPSRAFRSRRRSLSKDQDSLGKN